MIEKIDKIWLKYYPGGIPANLEYPNKTMPDLLEEAATKLPDRIAIAFAGMEISY